MSSTRTNPLSRLHLRNAQVLHRQRVCWEMQRDSINELRHKELKNVIAARAQTEKDIQLSAALDRMYQVRESQPIFRVLDADMRSLQSESFAEATSEQLKIEQLEIAEIALSSFSTQDSQPITPPGVNNIRQTPRRPGAPSAAPALIKTSSINAGARARLLRFDRLS